MKQRIMILLFGLGFFLGLLVLFGSTAQPAQAENSYQNSPCEAILADAASRADIAAEGVTWDYDENNPWICTVTYCWNCSALSGVSTLTFAIDGPTDPNDFQPYSCASEQCEVATFHGYPSQFYWGIISRGIMSDPYEHVEWYMEHGGVGYSFRVDESIQTDSEFYRAAMDLAEALWGAAEAKLPGAGAPPSGPVQENSDCAGMTPKKLRAGGVAVLQCRLHCDPNIMSDDELWACINQYSGGSDIPTIPGDQPGDDIPTIPGDPIGSEQPESLGPLATTPFVPLAGALVGTLLGWLVSVAATSGNVLKTLVTPPLKTAQPPAIPAGPETGEAKDQGLYWSERPWDQAGPGYVSKEEYEQTKDMLERGYKWTNGGWQTPDQISQSNQWQQNNYEATAREDAELQAKMEAERQALEQNKAELKKTADELQAASNMLDLKNDFEAINQNLQDENIYVLNPYQGDPTVVFHRLNTLKNLVWDNTGGWLTGSNGLTCEGYVEKTSQKVIEAVSERFPGATVQRMIFEEKSTANSQKDWRNWFDSFIDDNHNLTKITLPDGSEWALDYHQQNAGNAPLLRPWKEAREEWKVYMGKDEFVERVSATTKTIAPQPPK